MSTILRVFLGLGIVGAGVYMVLRTRGIIGFFGYVDWAEWKIGPGGSNIFYKCLGVLFCFLGFVVATNLWEELMTSLLGTFVPGLR